MKAEAGGLGLSATDLSNFLGCRHRIGLEMAVAAGALKRPHAGVDVGTLDKFQGQQAPVVLYSMATSSPELAPRGMEFLYGLNRLNVATSRAQCAAVVMASPKLFEPECRSPRQMQLAIDVHIDIVHL